MTLSEIRELIALLKETGVAELEVQRGDNRVRIRHDSAPQYMPQYTIAPSAAAAPPPAASAAAPAAAPSSGLMLVKSPIVGTFYEAASPGSEPFVKVGDVVQPGKVVCIIESMKLMNEIESEIAGVVESKLVSNGKPVEYGEALFGIRPL
jgi:acetyl-CoA carboxylase biotin carboxyl carrier protein